VDILFKIAAVGIIVMIINQVLSQSGRDDLAAMASLAGVVIVLMMVVDMIITLFDNVRSVFQFS
jgi:stage III sporulation protein AC